MKFAAILCMLGALLGSGEADALMRYEIPDYNVGRRLAGGHQRAASRKILSWKQQMSDQVLAHKYSAASEYLKATTVDGVQSSASVPEKDRVINYVEWGSNNGDWMGRKMREARAAGQAARCFTFEPLPRYRPNHEALVQEFNCTFYPTVVWTHEREFKFSVGVAEGMGSSVLNDSRIDPGVDENVVITAIDAAAWMMQTFEPTDYIFLRIDIEGAEYSVVRNIILRGTACWVDIMELEFHSIHHAQNYNKRPADVVLPWMLRACGVDVRTEAYYPDRWWKPDDKYCRQCDQLAREMQDDVAG